MSILVPVAVVSGLGLAFGLGLSYASKFFEVKVDERISAVREMLPVPIAAPADIPVVTVWQRLL